MYVYTHLWTTNFTYIFGFSFSISQFWVLGYWLLTNSSVLLWCWVDDMSSHIRTQDLDYFPPCSSCYHTRIHSILDMLRKGSQFWYWKQNVPVWRIIICRPCRTFITNIGCYTTRHSAVRIVFTSCLVPMLLQYCSSLCWADCSRPCEGFNIIIY